MKRTLLALGGVVLLLTTGCGSSGHRTSASTSPATAGLFPTSTTSTTATTATDPSTTSTVPPTTTTVPDTSVVPAHITVAYVDAVLVKLNHVYGDAVRSVVRDRSLTVRASEDLSTIYTRQLGANEVALFAQALGDLHNVRRKPGDPVTTVRHLIYSSSSCIFARVQTDSDSIVTRPVAPSADEYMGLSRISAGQTGGVNRTPWVLFFDLVNKTYTVVPNQCHVE